MAELHLATIEALALAIDAKDQTAHNHIRRVQIYATALARALGMSDVEFRRCRTAALLHDIGKLAVPEHILAKPGPLTPEEFQKVRLIRRSAPTSSPPFRFRIRSRRSSQTITSAGTAAAIRAGSRARRSRSARGFCASSTTSTR